MNNVIMRKLVLTADYQPLATKRVIGSFTISAPLSNDDDALFRGDEGDDVPWRGEYLTHPPVVENGQLVVPTRPGWGTDVNEEAVRARPPRKR